MKIRTFTTCSNSRRLEGYTLVEVMMAAMIMATMGVSLFAGLAFGYGRIQTTREDLRATQILTQKLEAIRLCTWSQLANCPTTFQDYYNPLGLANNTAGVLYQGRITIGAPSNIPSSASYFSQIRLITVSLTWTEGDGDNAVVHQRQMQTEAAYHGLQNYIWGKP